MSYIPFPPTSSLLPVEIPKNEPPKVEKYLYINRSRAAMTIMLFIMFEM